MITADGLNTRRLTLLQLVERVNSSDAAAIAELLRKLAPATLPVSERTIRSRIDRYRAIRQGGEIVACAALMPLDHNHLELRSLAVDPACGGSGLGTQLVSALQWEALRQGRHLRCVTVHPAFFERMGFTRIPLQRVPAKSARDDCPAERPRIAMEWRPDPDDEKGIDHDRHEFLSRYARLLKHA